MFNPRKSGTKDEDPNSALSKAKLVFEVFDKDESGKIAANEILQILRYMVNFDQFYRNSMKISIVC